MIETIEHNGKIYPAFQAEWNAAKYIAPFALEFCKGTGLDIGCYRPEWALPSAIPIDMSFDDPFHALNLPKDFKIDYIFSGHCLEHVGDWVEVLDYWLTVVRSEGVIFLYLPHYSQTYWRPWHNKKHKHVLPPEAIHDYFVDQGVTKIFQSGVDLNNSYATVVELA